MQEKSSDKNPHHLSAAQVAATIEASGLTRQEFARQVGCGTSQLFKYGQEGLPPRMDRGVRAAILQQAVQHGVIVGNAALRAGIQKLSKGRRDAPASPVNDAEPNE